MSAAEQVREAASARAAALAAGDAARLTDLLDVDFRWTSHIGEDLDPQPMTQFWARTGAGWTCLAGHAGPRLATRWNSSHAADVMSARE